ncbi:carbohydrate-binding module family 18 protein [Piromyces sp. E2]|nr:carbohydrate-binding module family 18 protein [Piromyces sp. E2]|eukprot:OUM67826.1 carbohydrate-binding module family 18 protein [Piromyces sp. E2]
MKKLEKKVGQYCNNNLIDDESICKSIRCGIENGENYSQCPSGQCCSKKGYCGTTSSYRSILNGCQKEHGRCVYPRCGIINSKDYGQCPSGQCCSKKGYCGTTPSFLLPLDVKLNTVNVTVPINLEQFKQ